jgi:glycerol uptake facilitator-like aquaporin
MNTCEITQFTVIENEESCWGAMLIEIMFTCALVFMVFSNVVDCNKGSLEVIATSLMITFVVLVNMLLAGPFNDGFLNLGLN